MADVRRRSRNVLVTMLVLSLAFASLVGEAAERRARGSVLAVFDDGSFLLEKGLRVRVTEETSLPRPLLVGQPVEVIGQETAGSEELVAHRLNALPLPAGELRGEALLEGTREDPRGVLLLADGRRLLVTARTERASAEDFAPGSYLTYRGRWVEGGVVELAEVSVTPNRLEEREKAIQEVYRPEIQFLARSPDQPAALRVGPNRYAVVDGPQVQLYFDRLGSRLVPALWRDPQAGERFGFEPWFVLVSHPTAQATAFPSGVIVVHTGLLHLAENEAQLAFVVAHELAHVLQEHAWRESAYHRKKLQALRWSTAGIGFLVESAIRRGYQRTLEAQADRLALWYLVQAGFDPREGVRMLQRLESRQEGLSALLWEKHRTFPQRRRAAMEELFRYSQQGLAYPSLTRNSGEFDLLRSRVPAADVKEAREPRRP
jgi:hypothetical protein